jgi:hypothetical protein
MMNRMWINSRRNLTPEFTKIEEARTLLAALA